MAGPSASPTRKCRSPPAGRHAAAFAIAGAAADDGCRRRARCRPCLISQHPASPATIITVTRAPLYRTALHWLGSTKRRRGSPVTRGIGRQRSLPNSGRRPPLMPARMVRAAGCRRPARIHRNPVRWMPRPRAHVATTPRRADRHGCARPGSAAHRVIRVRSRPPVAIAIAHPATPRRPPRRRWWVGVGPRHQPAGGAHPTSTSPAAARHGQFRPGPPARSSPPSHGCSPTATAMRDPTVRDVAS
jgi:hypothetical protein